MSYGQVAESCAKQARQRSKGRQPASKSRKASASTSPATAAEAIAIEGSTRTQPAADFLRQAVYLLGWLVTGDLSFGMGKGLDR